MIRWRSSIGPNRLVALDGLHLYLNDQFAIQRRREQSRSSHIKSDGGATLVRSRQSRSERRRRIRRQILAVSPLSAGEVYAVDSTGSGPVLQRSTDYGMTWTSLGVMTGVLPKNWNQDTLSHSLIPDASTAGRLYVTIEVMIRKRHRHLRHGASMTAPPGAG